MSFSVTMYSSALVLNVMGFVLSMVALFSPNWIITNSYLGYHDHGLFRYCVRETKQISSEYNCHIMGYDHTGNASYLDNIQQWNIDMIGLHVGSITLQLAVDILFVPIFIYRLSITLRHILPISCLSVSALLLAVGIVRFRAFVEPGRLTEFFYPGDIPTTTGTAFSISLAACATMLLATATFAIGWYYKIHESKTGSK